MFNHVIRIEERKALHLMAIYIVALHKQGVQMSIKNRPCHVKNISINLEHNHEPGENKLKDNNYEHE